MGRKRPWPILTHWWQGMAWCHVINYNDIAWHDGMSSCLMSSQNLQSASHFIVWQLTWHQNYLEYPTKLALADVSDVDDVVSRILQQLQPDQDDQAGEDFGDVDFLLTMLTIMLMMFMILVLIIVLKMISMSPWGVLLCDSVMLMLMLYWYWHWWCYCCWCWCCCRCWWWLLYWWQTWGEELPLSCGSCYSRQAFQGQCRRPDHDDDDVDDYEEYEDVYDMIMVVL